MRISVLPSLLMVFAALSASVRLVGQPIYRAGITAWNYLSRSSTVGGNFVRDLTQSDFKVFEDGKLQTISTFAFMDVDLSSPTPSLKTPADGIVSSSESRPVLARIYVFVLDDYFLPFGYTDQARRVVRLFVNQYLSDNDIVAVVFTSGAIGEGFTSERQRLLEAVDRFSGKWNPGDPMSLHEVQAISVWKTMRDVASRLSMFGGRRKAVFYVSLDVACKLFGMNSCGEAFWDAIRVAQQTDVSFYPLDPRGLLPRDSSDLTSVVSCIGDSRSRIGRRVPSVRSRGRRAAE